MASKKSFPFKVSESIFGTKMCLDFFFLQRKLWFLNLEQFLLDMDYEPEMAS